MWEGKSRCCDPRVRTPGHWDVPISACRRTGAKDARGGLMLSCLRVSVSALLVLLSPIISRAQTKPAQTPPAIHESVVVTATGRETPESKVGVSVTVINRDEIEQ